MITDNKLYLADRAEVTATGLAPKVIDMGSVTASFPQRPFYAVLVCHGAGSKNLQIKLLTADSATPTTDYVDMISSGVIAKEGLVRGAVYALPLPVLPSGLAKRYLVGKFVVGGTADGNETIADLGHGEELTPADGVTVRKPAAVGEKIADAANTYSLIITDQITEMKPWKFLDVMEDWDRTSAPDVGSSSSDAVTASETTSTKAASTK